MTDIISQKDIEKLLQGAMPSSEETETSPNVKNKPSSQIKTYKYEKDKTNFRYPTPYISPVVKREQIVYDPKLGQKIPEGKIVVMSLNNYIASKNQH